MQKTKAKNCIQQILMDTNLFGVPIPSVEPGHHLPLPKFVLFLAKLKMVMNLVPYAQ